MLAQPLTLEFKKSYPRPVLTVRRADGTATWMKLYPGMALHDLAHYVIETELALTDAFYGILARGYDIEAFEAPGEERPAALRPANLPPVALQVEHLVNLLLTELQSGALLPDFLPMLAGILAQAQLPPMEELTESALDVIRQKLRALGASWGEVAPDGVLLLEMA